MSKFNNMNDDDLKSFLKQNQPQAPQADSGELNALMRKLKIKNEDAESSPNTVWLWLATGLAASIFMFQFLSTGPVMAPELPVTPVAAIKPAVEPELKPASEAAPKIAATAVNEEDDDFSEESVPTLDIGEEYLTLAGF